MDSIGFEPGVGCEQLGDARVVLERDTRERVAALHSVRSPTLLLVDRLFVGTCCNRRGRVACGDPGSVLLCSIRCFRCSGAVVERRRPIDAVVGRGRSFGLCRRANDELLPDANEIAVEAVPFSDLFDRHAGTLRDQTERVALLHDHGGRFGFHSGRRQCGEAQQCDPERAEHPDPVYRKSRFWPRNGRKQQDVALLCRLDNLIGWTVAHVCLLWFRWPGFCH